MIQLWLYTLGNDQLLQQQLHILLHTLSERRECFCVIPVSNKLSCALLLCIIHD